MRSNSILALVLLISCSSGAFAQPDVQANRKSALAILSEVEDLTKTPIEVTGNGREGLRISVLKLCFQERLAWKDYPSAAAIASRLGDKWWERPQALRELALAYEKDGKHDDAKRLRDELAVDLKARRAQAKYELQESVWHELAIDCAMAGDDDGFRRFAIEGRKIVALRTTWLGAGVELAIAGREEPATRYFKHGWETEQQTQGENDKYVASFTDRLITEGRQAMLPVLMKHAPRDARFTSYLTMAAHQSNWEDIKSANQSFGLAFDELSALCLAETPRPKLHDLAQQMRRLVALTQAYDAELGTRLPALIKKLGDVADPAISSHGLVICSYLSFGIDSTLLLDRAMERAKDIKDPKANSQAKTMVLQAKRELEYIQREESTLEPRAKLDETRAVERERRKALLRLFAPEQVAREAHWKIAERFVADAQAGRWDQIAGRIELSGLRSGDYATQAVQPAVHRLCRADEARLAAKLLEVVDKARPEGDWSWMAVVSRPSEVDDSELVNRAFAKLQMWFFLQEDVGVMNELRTLAGAGEYDKARALKTKLKGDNAQDIIAAELAVAQALRADFDAAKRSAHTALASSDRQVQGRGLRALAVIGIKQLNKGKIEELRSWATEYKTRRSNEFHLHHEEPNVSLNRLMQAELKAGNTQAALEVAPLYGVYERQPALFRVLLHRVQAKDQKGAEIALKALGDPLAVKPWTIEPKLDQFRRPLPRPHFASLKLPQLLSLVIAYQKVGDEISSKHVLEFAVHQVVDGDVTLPLERIAEAYTRRAGVQIARTWADQLPPLSRARALAGVVKAHRPDSEPLSIDPKILDISEMYFQ